MTPIQIAQLVIFALQEAPVITAEVQQLVQSLHASTNAAAAPSPQDYDALHAAVAARQAAVAQANAPVIAIPREDAAHRPIPPFVNVTPPATSAERAAVTTPPATAVPQPPEAAHA